MHIAPNPHRIIWTRQYPALAAGAAQTIPLQGLNSLQRGPDHKVSVPPGIAIARDVD